MTGTRPALDRLRELLPVHVLARDEESGGLLAALLAAVAGELDLLERDVEELYASWFVETAPEWVVPYLGDLVGVTDLPPDLSAAGGAGVGRRAFVANTVAYRRRKGTAAVAEQVARDVTGWPAKAVEHHRLLAVAAHVNHVRTDRPATASLRTPAAAGGPLELVPAAVAGGALDPLAHTVDVRHVASFRGRYGIGNLGVHLFPDQVYAQPWSPARPPAGADAEGWSVHPLGLDGPLYAVPDTEDTIEHLAAEPDLAVPLRPRRLLALLAAARALPGAPAAGLPVEVRVDGADVTADRLRVARLEDLAEDPAEDPAAPLTGWQVFVDAVAGRLHPYLDGAPARPGRLEARFGYGGTADVGAGPWDRSAVHADALAGDPWVPAAPGLTLQAAVAADPADPDADPSPLAVALAAAEDAWAGPEPAAGGSYVVSIGDSGRYAGDLTVEVPEGTRLVLVAAAWRGRAPEDGLGPVPGVYTPEGLRPLLRGTLTVRGGAGSSVLLDGLTVEGDVVVGDGELGSLTLSQCTVAGRVRVGEAAPANGGVRVRVLRSVLGGIGFGLAAASLEVLDSVLGDGSGTAVAGEGLELAVTASTVRGEVRARTLSASSAILDGPVVVENRQTGCLRYSYAPLGSRVPRRFRCAPGPGDAPGTRPVYAAVDPGSPHHLALAPGCPPSVAEGGEDGSEMGVHHHLHRPVRVRAAARLLAPYVPVGLELGVRAPVAARTAGG